MKKEILLVEYATTTIEIIKEILSLPIFDLTIAHEGETAKQLLAEKPFDLMIAAAMLPKFHGFSLSQHAAENYPGIKIIITSHIYKGMEYRHQAISQFKADDFFEVPFDKNAFKKRVFELLEIDPQAVDTRPDMTTTQVPISDTRKIPTLKKLKEKEDQKELTSEELFGDIIDQVEKEPPVFEIDLNGEAAPKTRAKEKIPDTVQFSGEPLVTRLLKPPVTQVLDKKKTPPPSAATQKIDLDLLDLLQSDKKMKKAKEEEKLKKIEDDISRKLEDTLSGLGIGPQKKVETKTEPVKKPETKEVKTQKEEISGYEILGLIGRGGMAEIYKAKRKGVKGFEKVIALKKILSGYGEDVKYLEMFVDEAKIAAELSHPNIVQIYDLGQKDDYYFIAMEYVPGKDLRVVLNKLAQQRITMPEELAIYLIIRVLEALNYAHSARGSSGKRLEIVHRDVSPPNILISYNGNVKLTDFGVSKASIKMHQTLAGALKGKILYMSPEQARGEDNIDYRSDLYSVGIILFELITGEKLFLGSSDILTLKKVQEGKIIKPSQLKINIDPELESIIIKALEKNIEKRYQKAAEMINDLYAYLKKNYDSLPETNHLAYFIYTLFKEDIGKEGIDINIHAISQPVKQIERKKETAVPAASAPVKEPEQEQAFDLAGEEQMPVSEDEGFPLSFKYEEETHDQGLKEQLEKEEELPPHDEFQPVIEISFDEDKARTEAVPTPVMPGVDMLEQEKESKKKRNLLLVLFLVIVVLAIVIGVFIIDNLSSGKSKPGAIDQPASTVLKQPGADQESAALPPAAQEDEPAVAVTSDKDSQEPADTAAAVVPEEQKEKKEKKKKDEAPKTETAAEKVIPTTAPAVESPTKPAEEQPDLSPIEQEPPQTQEGEPTTVEETQTPAGDEKKPEGEMPPAALKEGDIASPSAVETDAVPISSQEIKISRMIGRLLLSDQRVFVTYLVDHNGNVETVKLIKKSSLKKLNELIIETIKKWKFKPAATKNNVKVKVWKSKWIEIKK
jgi:TonB family protein